MSSAFAAYSGDGDGGGSGGGNDRYMSGNVCSNRWVSRTLELYCTRPSF